MNEKTIETIQRRARLAFMAAVTAAMLALTFEHARRGLPGMATASVYALTVGFGLEFVATTWMDPGGDRSKRASRVFRRP
jgi:hypothetical protein